MDSKKLMIDDWVFVKGMPVKVYNVHNDCVNYEPDIPYFQEESYCSDDEIEYIPISKEILETNGFFNKGYHGNSNLYTMELNSHNYRIWIQLGDIPSVGINVYKNINMIEIHMRIEYIHELQHMFRLAGLYDLANNFKMK